MSDWYSLDDALKELKEMNDWYSLYNGRWMLL